MGWTALGESVPGTSHLARGVPCQDAFRFYMSSDAAEWLTIATADGAGSSSHSEIGATLVCDSLIRQVETRGSQALFCRDEVISLFKEARENVFAEATRLGVRPRELACTALLIVAGPSAAAVGQIGDGAVVLGSAGAYGVVFWPEPSEYANATDFLTDDCFSDLLRFETVNTRVAEIAAFTDGLQRLALDFASRTAYSGFFRPLFKELRAAGDPELLVEPFRQFLRSDLLNQRTDDDKTLVLAVRQP